MQIFTTKMVITNKSGVSHSRSPLGDFFTDLNEVEVNKFINNKIRLRIEFRACKGYDLK